MSDWNSTQYLKFAKERTQPAIDLAKRIDIKNAKNIIDIGCGPGNSTNVLASQFPDSHILGVDSSPNMIETAKKNYPDLDFKLCDVSRDLSSYKGQFDIVFSNACIQWIPAHNKLIPNLMGLLKDNGVLAVQTPMNYNEPIHLIIEQVVKSPEWSAKFPNPRIFYNLSESDYFDLLSQCSSDFAMWKTTYFHKMVSHQSIMEWYKSTGLKPYLSVLDKNDSKVFEKEILDRISKAYPKQKNGEIIFRFPRFFFITIK